MYYTYIIQSQKNGRFYIGSCHNIDRRIERHNAGAFLITLLDKFIRLTLLDWFIKINLGKILSIVFIIFRSILIPGKLPKLVLTTYIKLIKSESHEAVTNNN